MEIRMPEDCLKETEIRRRSVDDRTLEGGLEAGDGFASARPPSDDLGDKGIELGRDRPPLPVAGVDPNSLAGQLPVEE